MKLTQDLLETYISLQALIGAMRNPERIWRGLMNAVQQKSGCLFLQETRDFGGGKAIDRGQQSGIDTRTFVVAA